MQSNSPRRPLLGITGPAGCGKDTVASYLIEHYGYGRVSFAEPIRKFIAELCGMPRESLDDREIKEKVIPWIGKSPRQLMQTLGTEWGRDLINERLWILRAMKSVEDLEWAKIPAVISDVRFENEAEAIRARGGIIIHMSRPDAMKVASHISEQGVPRRTGDTVLLNDRTIQALHQEIELMLAYDLEL